MILLAKLEITSVSVGAILGIGLAFANAGVWSSAFQSVIASAATTLFLWLSVLWRPKWIFSWEEVKMVSDFSLNILELKFSIILFVTQIIY